MGFEPQTAGQPLVNVRKGPTKVNIAVVVGVILFLAAGVLYAVHVNGRSDRGEPVLATPAPAK